jgi:hypothetical protein
MTGLVVEERVPTAPSISRNERGSPPHRRRFNPTDSTEQVHTQLNKRLAGLFPEDFITEGSRVFFYSVDGMRPPPNFRHVWYTDGMAVIDALSQHLYPDHTVVCIVADLAQSGRIQASLQEFCDGQHAAFLTNCPIHLLVPHSESKQPECLVPEKQKVISQLMGSRSIDDVIIGEPKGMKLAFEVQSRLVCQFKRQANLRRAVHHLEQRDRVENLKHILKDSIWGYARMRLDTKIPEIDSEITPGEPSQIKNCKLGQMLGKGAYGKVFRIESEARKDDAPTNQVMKSVVKAEASFLGLKVLKSEIATMQLLSEQYDHPHITKLYEVYHSETHVFLRMEYGGAEDLSHRLLGRDGGNNNHEIEHRRPMSLSKAVSIIMQCTSTLEFLHSVPKVAHRDIKPSNLLLSEIADGAVIKFADFGLAVIANQKQVCRNLCGTFAYMAPEIHLETQYDCFAVDVWSMGIVLLEILCGVHYISRNIFSQSVCKEKRHLVQFLQNHFKVPGSVQKLLLRDLQGEYRSLFAKSEMLLSHMLDIMPAERWSAKQLTDTPWGFEANDTL